MQRKTDRETNKNDKKCMKRHELIDPNKDRKETKKNDGQKEKMFPRNTNSQKKLKQNEKRKDETRLEMVK